MTDTPHSDRPNGGAPDQTLRAQYAYFERWLSDMERFYEERDRRYENRFEGQEKAVAAALAAAEKQVTTAFAASEKAVLKAEDAQREYNIRSNEFRGQLDDQAKTLMPRIESISRFEATDKRSEETKLRLEGDIQDLRSQIGDLRESRSEGVGSNVALHESRQQSNWTMGQVITIALSLLAVAAVALEAILRSKP